MRIEVKVTESELMEMNTDASGLKQLILTDLVTSDIDGEYVGFNIVIFVEEDNQ